MPDSSAAVWVASNHGRTDKSATGTIFRDFCARIGQHGPFVDIADVHLGRNLNREPLRVCGDDGHIVLCSRLKIKRNTRLDVDPRIKRGRLDSRDLEHRVAMTYFDREGHPLPSIYVESINRRRQWAAPPL